MDIRPLEDAAHLNDLIQQQPLQPFLQTWAWGEFQAGIKRKIWRLGGYKNKECVGAALVIEHELMLGKTYLYCPRGPIAKTPEAATKLFKAIERQGKQAGAMYVKIDPPTYGFDFDPGKLSAYSPGTTLQPQQTLVLDLTKTPEELQATMHQKTRYNIRLAEKRGVQVRWSIDDADFKIFLDLMHATAARQSIRLHSDTYYRTMFESLRKAEMVELVIAEFEDKALVANLIIWHGQTATYLHGASSNKHKEIMAPYIVQWKTIERAQGRKCTSYDLWGIAPEEQPDHTWAGITRFKQGFGGHMVVFPPAANAVVQPSWYWAYRLAKRMRGGFSD